MATTKQTKQGDYDAFTRLANKGEATLARLADLPGGTKALKAFNDLRARVDDLSKKVRGIDALEARVAKLEKELAALKAGAEAEDNGRAQVRVVTEPGSATPAAAPGIAPVSCRAARRRAGSGAARPSRS